MAIISTELNWYMSKVVSFAATNGGRISLNKITNNLANYWWPNISLSELASGAARRRKSFLRIDNPNDEVASSVQIWLWKPTPGADQLYLFNGTQTDIQSDITTPDLFGAGILETSVSASGTELRVTVEDPTKIIFRDGETLRISDETTVGESGNAEFVVVSGTPTFEGSVAVITLAAGLVNSYVDDVTWVSSIIEKTNITGSVISPTVTSIAGTFDDSLVTVSNLGSLYQQITLTFTGSSDFVATSDEVGFSVEGSINSEFAINNVSVGATYFVIPSSCWGGTFQNGDIVTFITVPPAVPIWEQNYIPSGSPAINSQTRAIVTRVTS